MIYSIQFMEEKMNEIKNTIYISYSAPISQPEAKTIYITKPKIKNNTSHIGIKMIKQLTKQFNLVINPSNDFNETKWIIENLIELKKLCSKFELTYTSSIQKSEHTKYISDIETALKALEITDKKEQYTLIYENVCDYLDNQFREKNICDFKNDKCIANRENKTAHSIMGCCYSFEYAGFFSPQFIKNEQLCKYQQNRNCTTKCITCKLFTCKYLKEKGIKFDLHKILLLECFFNKKQHSILTSNFFKTEEEIINNLVNT